MQLERVCAGQARVPFLNLALACAHPPILLALLSPQHPEDEDFKCWLTLWYCACRQVRICGEQPPASSHRQLESQYPNSFTSWCNGSGMCSLISQRSQRD